MKRMLLLLLAAVAVVQSCVFENDIDYPYIKGEITAFEVEGQVSSSINPSTRQVSVVLEETADIERVKVKNIVLSPATSMAEELPEYLDLSASPFTVVLKTYQDYVWTISASRPIERYVRCEGQVGDARFNVENQVRVYLREDQSLSRITINEMKLGPKGSRIYSVDEAGERGAEVLSFPYTFENSLLSHFDVEYKGKFERWDIEFESYKISTDITGVIPWCHSADVRAMFVGEGEPYLKYRKVGGESWNEWKDVKVSDNGTELTASLSGLESGTDYEVMLVAGENESASVTFMTGKPEQLENMGFDDWYMGGKSWFPNIDSNVKIWDTANGGTAMLGKNATSPEYEFLATDDASNKAAARLESMVVGMFAAGNIYSGLFKKASFTGGVGAILDWGSPFTGRPKAIKGYYSYAPKQINKASKDYADLIGTMDKCQILVLLTDWDSPFEVDTAKGVFVDQENDPHIIAYKRFESDVDTQGEYVPFEFELEYRRPDATPKYAVVIACASYRGDYFTGGVGSVMYADEFEFVYD